MTINLSKKGILFYVNQFHFYHLIKNQNDPALLDKDSVIWETCLRKIVFSEKTNYENTNLDFYKNEEAMIFLLEVLCGLKSKVIGETEIFGQFKKFLESDDAKKISFFQNKQLVQFLLKEVKTIRDKYITKLGVKSYGSIIRKLCAHDQNISLLGYGQLAQKILPWISENNKVQIHVRDTQKYTAALNFHNLENSKLNSTVIIAAPIKTSVLIELIQISKHVSKVIDCRGLDHDFVSLKNKINSTIELFELTDLFSSLESQQKKINQFVPQVQKEIKEDVEAFYLKLYHRPLGWEDLCG